MLITKHKIINKLKKYTRVELLDALELIEQKAQIKFELLNTNFKIEMGEIETLRSENTQQTYYDGQIVQEIREEELKDNYIYKHKNGIIK